MKVKQTELIRYDALIEVDVGDRYESRYMC